MRLGTGVGHLRLDAPFWMWPSVDVVGLWLGDADPREVGAELLQRDVR